MKKDNPRFDSHNEVRHCDECPLQGNAAACKKWHDEHFAHPGRYTYAEACAAAESTAQEAKEGR